MIEIRLIRDHGEAAGKKGKEVLDKCERKLNCKGIYRDQCV